MKIIQILYFFFFFLKQKQKILKNVPYQKCMNLNMLAFLSLQNVKSGPVPFFFIFQFLSTYSSFSFEVSEKNLKIG